LESARRKINSAREVTAPHRRAIKLGNASRGKNRVSPECAEEPVPHRQDDRKIAAHRTVEWGAGVLQRMMQPRRYCEALLRKLDRRREEAGPGKASVTPVRRGQRSDDTRHAHGAAANDRIAECDRFAAVIEKAIGSSRRRRRLAAIEDREPVGLCVAHQHEQSAADARALRFHEIEHELQGDCRVDSRSALRQDVIPGVDRKGIRRGDHEIARDHQCLLASRRVAFGKRRARRRLRPDGRGSLRNKRAENDGDGEAAAGHGRRHANKAF